MNRWGLPASWTAIDLLDNLLIVAAIAFCAVIFVKIMIYAFKRGIRGREL